MKYLNNDSSIVLKNKDGSNTGEYILVGVDNSKKWYICHNLSSNENASLKAKLASRAKTAGLLGTGNNNVPNAVLTNYYTNEKYACMLVLNLAD